MLISTETISLYRYKNGNIKEIIKLEKEAKETTEINSINITKIATLKKK